jgi:hypothetical protein
MNHQDIISQKIEFLNGNSSADLDNEALKIVSADVELAKEIQFIEAIWIKPELESSSKPSAQMQARFYQMLSHAQTTESSQTALASTVKTESFFSRLGLFKPAFQMLLVLVVFSGGWMLSKEDFVESQNSTIAMEKRIDTLNVMVALSLMKQNSIADRLVGVDYAKGGDLANEQLTSSLLHLLNSDRSSAVRLSVVDVLASQNDQDILKTSVVDSLSRQKNVLVQMALLELLQGTSSLTKQQLTLIYSNQDLDYDVRKLLDGKNKIPTNSI